MTERSASATALAVALLRAVHQAADEAPRVLDDPVSERLFDRAALQRAIAADGPAERALRAHVVLRSRFAEDRLAAAVARGVRQLVVLGAGYDTFAYRQPPWASGLRVFEVDHPASQRAKRALLAARGVAVPGNVTYVPLDFARTPLAVGLAASAFDPNEPAFFSWLGVMMYLDAPAIDAVLRFVAAHRAGSELAFSFANAGAPTHVAADRAAAHGEPWLSRHDPDDLARTLREAGFSSVRMLAARDAAAYFGTRNDALRAPASVSIGSAVKIAETAANVTLRSKGERRT